MSQTFFAILTAIGEAKFANAVSLGVNVTYSAMAVGDGNGVVPIPDRSQVGLANEVRRAPINQLFIDPDNAAQIVIEQVIPESVGGWWIREVGVFDEDGDMIAVANVPPTYKPQLQEGSGRTQVVRVVLLVSSSAAVTLKVDPSVVLATKQYVTDVFDTPSGVIPGNYGNNSRYPIITVDKRGRVISAGEVQVASVWDQIPVENIGDIIFVKGLGEMWWVENEWLTGYRTKACGFPAQTIDRTNRSFTIALDGGFFDKTLPKFKGLYSFIQENDLLVPEVDYQDGEFFFCEAGSNMIKLPNQDDMFWRNKGIDRDTANARPLGSYQADALQNITGALDSISIRGVVTSGAIAKTPRTGNGGSISDTLNDHNGFDFDASRVARVSVETRSSSAAVAPYIHI